jgi:hypothetical protein
MDRSFMARAVVCHEICSSYPTTCRLFHHFSTQKNIASPKWPDDLQYVLGAKTATSIVSFDGYFQLSCGRASRFCSSSLFSTVLVQIGYNYLLYAILLFLTGFLSLREDSVWTAGVMPASRMSEQTAIIQEHKGDICYGSYLQASRNRDCTVEAENTLRSSAGENETPLDSWVLAGLATPDRHASPAKP